MHRPSKEHLHHFSVLPGRCEIRVTVNVPEGIQLVEPPTDDCIWRQARGSAAEISGSEDVATATEKVGVAQQWFDELDNLAFSKESNETGALVEEKFTLRNVQDTQKAHFECVVNISPGTGEVVVSAVLYLKLSKTQGSQDRTLEAMRILNLHEGEQRTPEDDACISLLVESGGELRDRIFMKPLHLRIRLDCRDHPPATTTTKESILTETALEVSVSLD